MKTFFLLALLMTAFFIWLNRDDSPTLFARNDNDLPKSVHPIVQATPRPVSEHNWAKHSLDRAHEVVDQAQKTRTEDGQP